MKGVPLIFGLIFFGFFLIILFAHYETEEIRYDCIETTINEASKIASVKSLDLSKRTRKNEAHLDQNKFREEFQKAFLETNNVSIEDPKINYRFFKDNRNNVFSVNIKIQDKENRIYNKTCALDLK